MIAKKQIIIKMMKNIILILKKTQIEKVLKTLNNFIKIKNLEVHKLNLRVIQMLLKKYQLL